jgi:hypothetical protein
MIDPQLVKQRSRGHGSTALNPLFQTSATILVCVRYGIGDVVMQTPALDALRRAAPSAYIVALGAPLAVELLAQDAAVDEIVDVKRIWGLTHWYDAGEGRIEAIQQWLAEHRRSHGRAGRCRLRPHLAQDLSAHVLGSSCLRGLDAGMCLPPHRGVWTSALCL